MKKKELGETRKKSITELVTLLDNKKKELVQNRLEHAIRKIKNTQSMKMIRYDIAQILTIIEEKKLLEKQSLNTVSKK